MLSKCKKGQHILSLKGHLFCKQRQNEAKTSLPVGSIIITETPNVPLELLKPIYFYKI